MLIKYVFVCTSIRNNLLCISPSPDDFGRWKRYSFIGFKTLKHFSKDETGQKGPSFAIIIPPSSA